MGEISINLGKTEQLAGKITSLGNDLRDYSRQIEQVSDKLRKNHGDFIDLLCDKINLQNEEVLREAKKMDYLSDSMGLIVAEYTETENRIEGSGKYELRKLKNAEDIKLVYRAYKLDNIYSAVLDPTSLKEFVKDLKTILKTLDKAGNVSEAGILKDSISYIESLIEFLMGDKKKVMGAASDWFDLADSSISVWTKIYEYYKKRYEGTNTGIFSAIAEKKVAAVGVASGFLALLSTALSAKNEGKVTEYIECGNDVLSIIKADYKLRHIGDSKSLSKIKAGVWSAMDLYTAIGKSGVSAVKQAFQSYEKYFADGKWSSGDTGATGVDIAMAGLYGLAHELTYGVDDFIYGWVDKISGGHKDPNMSYAQKAAEGYKICANKIGEEIGNWWNNLRK